MITLAVYLVTPNVAPRGTISLVVGLFFFVGIQLIFIGLLGEYVTAIHAQVRRGPTVIERERINLPDLGGHQQTTKGRPAEDQKRP